MPARLHARDEALRKKYKALFHGTHIVVEEDRKQARTRDK